VDVEMGEGHRNAISDYQFLIFNQFSNRSSVQLENPKIASLFENWKFQKIKTPIKLDGCSDDCGRVPS
jgi:hypothetical protein